MTSPALKFFSAASVLDLSYEEKAEVDARSVHSGWPATIPDPLIISKSLQFRTFWSQSKAVLEVDLKHLRQ